MTDLDIPGRRLHSQKLLQTSFKHAGQVVSWLGAVQAQDYAGAKWALGQRMTDATDSVIDRAFADGSILRTHLLRPTWHFVTPADIRWLLMLTGPRVQAGNAFMYRRLELDKAIVKKSYAVLEKALQGNKHLTRSELASAFERAGIVAEGIRLGYFMMSAELDGIICSGPRKGKQFTYALLEERVPPVKALKREQALAELVRRYFATRGPATLQDFMWWSGLTMADAKNGIELVRSQFVKEAINDKTYWFKGWKLPAKEKSSIAHLLPNYDEYFIGLKDRSAIGDVIGDRIDANDPAFIAHIIIVDGQIVGGWIRTLTKDSVTVDLNHVAKLTKVENEAVAKAADRYGKFLGLPITLTNKGEHK